MHNEALGRQPNIGGWLDLLDFAACSRPPVFIDPRAHPNPRPTAPTADIRALLRITLRFATKVRSSNALSWASRGACARLSSSIRALYKVILIRSPLRRVTCEYLGHIGCYRRARRILGIKGPPFRCLRRSLVSLCTVGSRRCIFGNPCGSLRSLRRSDSRMHRRPTRRSTSGTHRPPGRILALPLQDILEVEPLQCARGGELHIHALLLGDFPDFLRKAKNGIVPTARARDTADKKERQLDGESEHGVQEEEVCRPREGGHVTHGAGYVAQARIWLALRVLGTCCDKLARPFVHACD
eukprot:scaffold3348_cov113-Isochrysis_galbana.AAC.4